MPDRVGYKNPPKHSRFKPGKSGNPRGRPKRDDSVDIGRELAGIFLESMPVTANGARQKLPVIVILYKQLVQSALQGDQKALTQAMRLAADLGVLKHKIENKAVDFNLLSEEEKVIMRRSFALLDKARVRK